MSYTLSYFYMNLLFISVGIFLGLLLVNGILKYLFIAVVLLYIYLVFIYIEHCILQFIKDIGEYELTTMLKAYLYMLVNILFYACATYSFFDIGDYIFIVLAIIEISYLYYKKKDITKGYAKFPLTQFSHQKISDFCYSSEVFPELKIKKSV